MNNTRRNTKVNSGASYQTTVHTYENPEMAELGKPVTSLYAYGATAILPTNTACFKIVILKSG